MVSVSGARCPFQSHSIFGHFFFLIGNFLADRLVTEDVSVTLGDQSGR
jgi:hypothetical protein